MKKSVYRTILLTFAIIALVTAAIFLLLDRILPKAFSDIAPNMERFDTCQIVCVTDDREDEATIAGDELRGLLSLLNEQQYYKSGSYDATLEGEIYHLYFSSAQEEVCELTISDLGKVYLWSVCYELSSDTNPAVISDYLETVLQ